MAQSSWPFENIDTSETQFSQWARNIGEGVKIGVGDELEAFADNSGLNVKVRSGESLVRGHYYKSTDVETLTISTPDSTNPRIDSVVLELDPIANSVSLKVIAGTPASSPVAPTLVQTDNNVWQQLIANVAVATGAFSIEAGDVSDLRTLFSPWTNSVTEAQISGTIAGSKISGSITTATLPGANLTGSVAGSLISGSITTGTLPGANVTGSITTATLPAGNLVTSLSDKSANYTIVAGDKNTFIRLTGATGRTFTIANVLAIGESVNFIQDGTGQITFVAGAGVTLGSADNKLKTNKQYSGATVVCVASGQYRLVGDLAA
jgi:hypothetical protein